MRKLMAMLMALMVIAAACGDDDDSGSTDISDDPLAMALADSVVEEDSPFATQEDANCFAGKVVGEIGTDRLNELGVTETNVGEIEDIDFTEGEIDTIVDAMSDCVDLTAALAAEFEADFGAEGAECLAEGLGDDLLTDLMKSSFTGEEEELPDEFFQQFLDLAAECDLPLN